MDESFSTHYQIHHLNSVIATSYLKGGVSQKYRGVSQKNAHIFLQSLSYSSKL
jgi:hypothetical protein